jgi:RNA-directed DNA polymerase
MGSEIEEVVEADAAEEAEGNTGSATRRDTPSRRPAPRFHRSPRPRACTARVAEELGRSRRSVERQNCRASASERSGAYGKSERRNRSDETGEPTRGTLSSKERRRNTRPSEGTMDGTKGSTTISTRLERIAALARQFPGSPLTTLSHHIDIEWLREAYRRTRKDGAPGIDGQSAKEYAADLEGNLQRLLERAKAGVYRAPPVRRTYIPKGTGERRPLGIPTFEDKVLQRAVAMVLETVYEQEFLDCSYGFRPGRSAHQALEAIQKTATRTAGGWAIEIDIRKYFDTIDHRQLQEVLRQRVRDGVIVRLIGKWLHAGVMEDGALRQSDAGTPQGGVISPLLANIYLHTVLDTWFERDVRPRMRGSTQLVRYADDAVVLFANEEDARRVMAVLPKRFAQYGLTLHSDKTRLVAFERPDRPSRNGGDGPANPGSLDFLGFTIHWRESPGGRWNVKLRTAKDRFRRTLTRLSAWCKAHRHAPLRDQQQALNQRLRGHYGYFDWPGNRERLWTLLRRVERAWWRWLSRRSQRARLSSEAMRRLLARYPLERPKRLRPA